MVMAGSFAWIAAFFHTDIIGFMGGVIGFIVGMLVGMGLNAWLLRGVPREKMRRDKKMGLRYGSLNWSLGALGALVGSALG
jgi:hypothetical protein